MKLFKKMVAFVSVIAMISSMSVFNIANAADKEYSLALTDASGKALETIKTNDEFYIEVRINNDYGLRGIQYKIDVKDLKVDNTEVEYGTRPKYKLPAFVDHDGFYANTDLNYSYWSTKTVKYIASEKKISVVGSGDAIDEYAADNALYGRFKVTADRDYTASNPLELVMIDCEGTDSAKNTISIKAATLTFPEAVEPPVVEDNVEVDNSATKVTDGEDIVDGKKTVSVDAKVNVSGTASFNRLTIVLNNGSIDSKPIYWDFETPISATSTFGLNILGCPENVTITVPSIVPSTVTEAE